MRSLKVNFTVPQDVAEHLKKRISKRGRSAFVSEAIREKLRELERQELCQALEEGYSARQEEDTEINREWETATLEGWQ